MSVRLLSDPDLGTHLSGGRWIVSHHAVPQKDFSTYTVPGNEYTDVYWFFQILVFGIYSLGGYQALSLLVTVLSVLLFLLLWYRSASESLHGGITTGILLLAFLVIEPRLILRPEMVTFLFLTALTWVLDLYFQNKNRLLFLLPLIMLFWCNVQGLFVLGLIVTAVYFFSKSLTDKKPELRLGLFFLGSLLACFCNPYFIRGFLFPFELFTRLEGENIFHQHIRELTSFSSLDALVAKDYLFLAFTLLTVASAIITIRRRKLHETILLLLFMYLAFTSVRNVPLFVIAAFPVLNRSLNEIRNSLSERGYDKLIHTGEKLLWWSCIIVPLVLIPRLITNEYYHTASSNNKTGLGIDPWYQPVKAAGFIQRNSLNERFINSLAFGGWLSWSLQQPVFIDGRLEVIKEALYLEVVESWKGNLAGLINKYKPGIIIYNYPKYYPWTLQLVKMTEWKLVYIDGFAVIYAREGTAGGSLEVKMQDIAAPYLTGKPLTEAEREEILSRRPLNTPARWLRGFYKCRNFKPDEILNIASFCLQAGYPGPAEQLFLEYLRTCSEINNSVYYALGEIYRVWKLKEPAIICYSHILAASPHDLAAQNALNELSQMSGSQYIKPKGEEPRNEAVRFFNQGNEYFNSRQPDKALNAYNEAIRLDPAYVKALNNRGILKASAFGQFREAISDFSRVIRLDPSNADAYLGRGSCHFQLKEADSACGDWKKAFSLGKQEARLLLQQNCGGESK